jgi:hypothetical protein
MAAPSTRASSSSGEIQPSQSHAKSESPKRSRSSLRFEPSTHLLMSPRIIRKLHRWLGFAFSLSVLMASGSGVIHTLMTRTQAPPPAAQPSGGSMNISSIRLSPAEALANLHGIEDVKAINIRGIGGKAWYQIYTNSKQPPQYVCAEDGQIDPSRDEAYATDIASDFLGGKTVKKTDYLTAFNMEYLNIFRVLPVYRFDLGDELQTRVYVATYRSSAATRSLHLHSIPQAWIHPRQRCARHPTHSTHHGHIHGGTRRHLAVHCHEAKSTSSKSRSISKRLKERRGRVVTFRRCQPRRT